MADESKARLTAEIPKELMRRLRVRAAETDREIRDMVAEAIEAYLNSSRSPKKASR
jgi:hypothetical protein